MANACNRNQKVANLKKLNPVIFNIIRKHKKRRMDDNKTRKNYVENSPVFFYYCHYCDYYFRIVINLSRMFSFNNDRISDDMEK